MVGGALEREPRRRVVRSDHDEVVAGVSDRLVQQRGVEAGERSWVRAVENDVVKSCVHNVMIPVALSGQLAGWL
jgi:hypothetical protein